MLSAVTRAALPSLVLAAMVWTSCSGVDAGRPASPTSVRSSPVASSAAPTTTTTEGTPSTITPSTTEAPPPPPTTRPTGSEAPAAVRTFWYDMVDARRGRTLKTLVHVPDGPGPFPLAVLAHGYRLPAAGYETIL